ncbi:MAG: hypothetical protein HC887_03690 [Desulfobacteraceae bacterium]|nr:hypothetical protein [Desulfobacteraceae bacterium]
MSGASTVATDSAQIVMMDKTLRKIPELFDIGYNFQDNMKDAFLTISGAGAVGISSVLFAHSGVVTMFLFRILSIVSGAAVAMIPAIKSKQFKAISPSAAPDKAGELNRQSFDNDKRLFKQEHQDSAI